MNLRHFVFAVALAPMLCIPSLARGDDPAPANGDGAGPTTQPSDLNLQKNEEYFRHLEEITSAEISEVEAKIHHLQQTIPAATGLFDASADSLHQEGVKLNEDLASVQLDYVAGAAGLDAIAEQLDQVQQKASKAVADSPILAELQKIVDLRQKDLDRTTELRAKALAPEEDVEAKSIALADAKAQLLTEQERVAAASGGDLLADLQKQAIDTTIAQKERAARIKELQAKRDVFIEAIRQCDELTELEFEEKEKHEVLMHLQDKLDQLNIAQELAQPATQPAAPRQIGTSHDH